MAGAYGGLVRRSGISSAKKRKGGLSMKTKAVIRATAMLLVLAVAALGLGCADKGSYDRFDPKRQAKQEDLLRWMQDDHRL